VTEQENGLEAQTEAKEAGNRLMQMVAWLAVAAVVVLVIALCVLVLYIMGIF